MTTLVQPPPLATPVVTPVTPANPAVVSSGRPRRPITAREFWEMERLGWFAGQNVELLGGEIVFKMSQSNLHFTAVDQAIDVLKVAFGPNFWVRGQGSLDLSPLSIVDPDGAVVEGARIAWRGCGNPTTALLVVEVSLSTLAEDQTYKASLYAAAGIADYWLVNLVDSVLEVRRDPVPLASAPFGFVYSRLGIHTPNNTVSPLAAPHAIIAVADLLPQ